LCPFCFSQRFAFCNFRAAVIYYRLSALIGLLSVLRVIVYTARSSLAGGVHLFALSAASGFFPLVPYSRPYALSSITAPSALASGSQTFLTPPCNFFDSVLHDI
jgi:hypothetical protein